jgi:5-methyltetrahydropteroyltriglutamate--homocysteine methyltransferase
MDIPLKDIIDVVLTSTAQVISFEGANPRHEHEWAVFKDVKLPDDRVLMPGVIDSTTNFIEHPELIAQRIMRYAELVGKERVFAATDCGFGTNAASTNVDPRITWAKLSALSEGAALASKQLW